MSTETEQDYQLTEEEQRTVDEITEQRARLAAEEQRHAEEINERRGRLVAALLAATTALGEAVEQIDQLRSNSVYDPEFAGDWRIKQLVSGAGQFLDALIADVDYRLSEYAGPSDAIKAARVRAGDRARVAYLDALANAVPLLSAGALAARPLT